MGWRNWTASQRYNYRMDKIFKEAMASRRNPVNKSVRRHYAKVSRRKK